MKDALYGDLSVIGMKGCEQFVSQVDAYLKEWRRHSDEVSFIVDVNCPRFGTGEAKGTISKSLRGHDVYIVCDPFNYGVTYKMYGKEVIVGIRPECIHDEPVHLSTFADAVVDTNVEVTELMGAEIYLYLKVGEETNLIARVSSRSTSRAGDEIKVAFDTSRIHIFDKDTERCIGH